MGMTPRLTKFALTSHIIFSVSWLGAVAGFLVLSIAGVTSHDVEIVRSVYLSMNLIGFYIIVPLSFGSLATGLVQSLGTSWGLFRQYWTVVKLVLTTGAVLLLLIHQFMAVERAAKSVSVSAAGTMPNVGHTGDELVNKAALAILVLLVTTTLSVYKPWGLTQYGRRIQRKLREGQSGNEPTSAVEPGTTGFKGNAAVLRILLVAAVVLVGVLIVVEHLTGHLLMHHGF